MQASEPLLNNHIFYEFYKNFYNGTFFKTTFLVAETWEICCAYQNTAYLPKFLWKYTMLWVCECSALANNNTTTIIYCVRGGNYDLETHEYVRNKKVACKWSTHNISMLLVCGKMNSNTFQFWRYMSSFLPSLIQLHTAWFSWFTSSNRGLGSQPMCKFVPMYLIVSFFLYAMFQIV